MYSPFLSALRKTCGLNEQNTHTANVGSASKDSTFDPDPLLMHDYTHTYSSDGNRGKVTKQELDIIATRTTPVPPSSEKYTYVYNNSLGLALAAGSLGLLGRLLRGGHGAPGLYLVEACRL